MNHDLISYGLNVLPDLKGDQFQIDLAVDSVDIMCLVRFRFGEETSGMVWSELDVFFNLKKEDIVDVANNLLRNSIEQTILPQPGSKRY